MLKPVPEQSRKSVIAIYDEIFPTAKALVSSAADDQLRNNLAQVIDANEFVYKKLKSGNQNDIDELNKYLNETQSTTAGYLGRLILAIVNVLGDLSHKKHASNA